MTRPSDVEVFDAAARLRDAARAKAAAIEVYCRRHAELAELLDRRPDLDQQATDLLDADGTAAAWRAGADKAMERRWWWRR